MGNQTVRSKGNQTVRSKGNQTLRSKGNQTLRSMGNQTSERKDNPNRVFRCNPKNLNLRNIIYVRSSMLCLVLCEKEIIFKKAHFYLQDSTSWVKWYNYLDQMTQNQIKPRENVAPPPLPPGRMLTLPPSDLDIYEYHDDNLDHLAEHISQSPVLLNSRNHGDIK